MKAIILERSKNIILPFNIFITFLFGAAMVLLIENTSAISCAFSWVSGFFYELLN
ncbi:hypothetical protein Runsl_4037 [Runella slithyformis DSM 19594]|uniref:Uncharacterized protein n=1 Tax=Runella slithyformis (strain ATCC 29530 / DSM 19594 / LMG 11500 / NCIMB 11436 / LSU 4) TaxID=761193 RepID=A0A7U3ZND9_RUNSL|nr:hypothetical protein Runsl_4037 [Runella slithyformis DSM 19594]